MFLVKKGKKDWEGRFISSSNQYFYLLISLWFILGIIAISSGDINNKNVLIRLALGFLFLVPYPLLLLLKNKSWGRFYLAIQITLVGKILPLLNPNTGEIFLIYGPYHMILALFFTLWCLHPKRDKVLFWLAIVIQLPFAFFSPFILKYFYPALDSSLYFDHLISTSVVPGCFYLAALYGGVQLVLSRENSIENLSLDKNELLLDIKENEKLEEKLKELINKYNDEFKDIAWVNSHIIRLDAANLLGLLAIMKSENNQANDEVFSHLENSINRLNESINEVNERLQDNIKEKGNI